jgi:DNA-binding HxlR family transcriptional regulator
MNQFNIDTAAQITGVSNNTHRYLQIAFAAEDLCVEVLGRSWVLSILRNIATKEAVRFNELKKLMPGISSNALANRLLELEREGLISKRIYPEIPLRVEYRFNCKGKGTKSNT